MTATAYWAAASSKRRGHNCPFWLRNTLLRRPLLTVWLFALVTQAASVRWLVGPYVDPNLGPQIGWTLAETGTLSLNDWRRLKGERRPNDPPLRAFELPGEPMWFALGFRVSQRLGDYWNVPVAALLIVSVAAVALALGGPALALIAGLLAAIDPATLLHASDRDDAVLGSALLWAVFAIVALRWRGAPRRPLGDLALFLAAGAATITRAEAGLMLVLLLLVKTTRRDVAVAVAGAVIAACAWGVRNQIVLGHFMVGSSHDGITLWESNGPFARQSLARGQVDIVSMDSAVMAPVFRETQDLDEAGANAYFRRQAVRYMVSHPLDVARTSVAKIWVSLSSVHPQLPLTAPRNLAGMLDNALLLVLAGLGLARFARSPATPVFIGLGVVTLALLAIGPAGMRYWLTLRGAAWVLAAVAISTLSGPLRRTLASSAPALP